MHAVIAEADAFGLEHVERAGEVGNHRIWHGVARTLPLAQGSPREPRTSGQIFHRKVGECATGAQLITSDSDCEHGNNSAPIGRPTRRIKIPTARMWRSKPGSLTYCLPEGLPAMVPPPIIPPLLSFCAGF